MLQQDHAQMYLWTLPFLPPLWKVITFMQIILNPFLGGSYGLREKADFLCDRIVNHA